jgi:hypothetical protein
VGGAGEAIQSEIVIYWSEKDLTLENNLVSREIGAKMAVSAARCPIRGDKIVRHIDEPPINRNLTPRTT